jgi:hypothetical protein
MPLPTTTFGPAYPAPLGVTYSETAPSADPANTDPIQSGGMNFTYTVADLSDYVALGWGQGLPDVSLDGGTTEPTLTFVSTSGLTATWGATAQITSLDSQGYSGSVQIELVATIVSGASGWVADSYSSASGAPAEIALINSGSFVVNLQWLAEEPGGTWESLANFYNNDKATSGAGGLQTSSDGEFAGQLEPISVATFLASKSSIDASATLVVISDDAAKIAANIDVLAADSNITEVIVSDHGTVAITLAQASNDANLLAEIDGPYTLELDATASEVSVLVGPSGDVELLDSLGEETLPGVTAIDLSDASIAINGNVVTETDSNGSKTVSTFNVTGHAYTSSILSYAANGQLVSALYEGVTGEGNLSSFEYLYAGNNLIGTDEFYTGITGKPYTGQETDYNGAGVVTRDVYSGVTGQPFSSYEYDFVGGVYAGAKFAFTSVPAGASYSFYMVDENSANAFSGEQFFSTNIAGQSYTGEEEEFDANAKLSEVLLTGVTGQAYSSLELDYSAGTYTGYKAYYDVTGHSYTNEEADVSASGHLEKVVYSGMTSTPYSSVEQDYSGGALSDVIYGFTGVTGASYNAYQVEDNASGAGLQETIDLNNGGHTLYALASGQTLTSQGDDTMVGSGAGATTFVFDAIYGHDTITNFTSADTISLPSSEFANFAAMDTTSHVTSVAGNAVITATDGDTLTIDKLSTSALAGLSGNFTYHS